MKESVRQTGILDLFTEKTQFTNKTETNNDYTLDGVYNTYREGTGGYTKYKNNHEKNIFSAACSDNADRDSVL